MSDRIFLMEGDITRQKVDAIVNAANESLLGGGGVDGAIHRAAGPELLQECRALRGCPTGEARITKGYRLPAPYIIHTVGPIWRGGSHLEDEFLSLCYRNSLFLAVENSLKSIAFPSISTGAYGFPMERAASIALREIQAFLKENSSFQEVRLICFGSEAYEIYRKVIRQK